MTTSNNGVGSFTAENIVAIFRALPETDGTYAQVIVRAREYGANVSKQALTNWVNRGRQDIRDGHTQTAYSRFSRRYDELKDEHCTCDCSNEKIVNPDGSLADTCRECQDIEKRTGRPASGPPPPVLHSRPRCRPTIIAPHADCDGEPKVADFGSKSAKMRSGNGRFD